ncbi:hypothetical protein C0585_03785 [Candidatus Woesearchaeota archaeon]|nr:MAG: hypothetical protein C0585_03785 [Candidatus Woesearchaeota archaeon]
MNLRNLALGTLASPIILYEVAKEISLMWEVEKYNRFFSVGDTLRFQNDFIENYLLDMSKDLDLDKDYTHMINSFKGDEYGYKAVPTFHKVKLNSLSEYENGDSIIFTEAKTLWSRDFDSPMSVELSSRVENSRKIGLRYVFFSDKMDAGALEHIVGYGAKYFPSFDRIHHETKSGLYYSLDQYFNLGTFSFDGKDLKIYGSKLDNNPIMRGLVFSKPRN